MSKKRKKGRKRSRRTSAPGPIRERPESSESEIDEAGEEWEVEEEASTDGARGERRAGPLWSPGIARTGRRLLG
jgi:hypothetical protein